MTNNTRQLPDEVVAEISMKATLSVAAQEFKYPEDNWTTTEVAEREYGLGYEAGATEYAIKLHLEQENNKVNQQEIETLSKELRQKDGQYNTARTLLQKFISRHEAGLLPDRFIYDEIKTFLNGK